MTSSEFKSADEQYAAYLAHYRGELREAKQKLFAFHKARRNVTYAIAASAVAAYLLASLTTYLLVIIALLAVVLSILHWLELRCRCAIAIAESRVWINRCGIARRERDWETLPERDVDDAVADSPLSIDLDLFGHTSLIQWLCTAETEQGISTLARWLFQPSTAAQIHRRQQAAKALAPALLWRQELQRRCLAIAETSQQTQRLIEWGTAESTIRLPQFVRWYVLGLRLLLPIMLAMYLFRPDVATVMLAALLLANFSLTIAYSGEIHSFYRGIFGVRDARPFSYLSATFAHVRDSRELRQVMPEICDECEQAVHQLKRLEQVLFLESIGGNPFTTAFVYIPLQFLLLWDLQVYVAIYAWHHQSGERLASWFQMLGEVEATSALASVSFEQPTWVYPEVGVSSEDRLTSAGLGHPLLPDESRVVNDVTIGPSGSMLLITGSNMGGKSTLLRAVGLNVVLAQAGAACCCRQLTMPLLTVMTSMRVSDSLSDSTSLFMAQLLQIKRIVDHLRAQQDGSQGALVLYLFDEILNGTNTTDRRRAVEELVGYLLRCRAIGAMSTHDLEIATQSRYKDTFQTYYLAHQLEESEEGPELKFDYKLREGVAPSSNAMLLVRLLGIPKSL